MKLIKLLLLLLVLSLPVSLIAQINNLIHNAGFEDGDADPHCYGDHFDEYLHVWESRYDHCNGEPDDQGCYEIKTHSPDWYKSPSFGHCGVYARGGSHYVGMADYELIEQKFFEYNRLEEDVNYLLRMYVYISKGSTYGCADINIPERSKIDIYLSKLRVKYKAEDANTNNPDEMICSEKWMTHRDQIGQNIIREHTFYLSDYPTEEWILLECNITPPDLGWLEADYKWFTIELRNINESDYYPCDCQENYILIDDITLAAGCTNGCSSTAGFYNIATDDSHYKNDPFTIIGLQNISHVQVNIITLLGAVLRTINITNPPNIIEWDGKSASGQEAAAATYMYKIIVTNDCGTETYKGYFEKVNAANNPTDYSPYFDYNTPVSKPPIPECCQENIYIADEILIQDKTLNSPLLYKADNLIQAGPNVIIPADNEVVFEAGQEIILLPGFETEEGAEFLAQIVPCDPDYKMLLYNDNCPYSKEYINEELKKDSIDNIVSDISQKENIFKFYPNPFKEKTNIIYTVKENEKFDISIYNIYGIKLYSLINGIQPAGKYNLLYDTSNLSNGVYICIFSSKNRREIIKLLKY